MIQKALVAALVALGLVAGPALAGDQHYRVVATDPASGSKVVVPLGDDLVLLVKACEDCGYSWKLLKKPDPSVIAFDRRMSSQNPCKSPCTGGTAYERFRFSSKGDGTTTVKLGYFGPGKSTPSKVKRLRLEVTG